MKRPGKPDDEKTFQVIVNALQCGPVGVDDTEAQAFSNSFDATQREREGGSYGFMTRQILIFRDLVGQQHERKSDAPLDAKSPSKETIGAFTQGEVLIPKVELDDWSALFDKSSSGNHDSIFRVACGDSKNAVGTTAEFTNAETEPQNEIERTNAKLTCLAQVPRRTNR